ncbi:MAG: phosphatidylglycerol lysyltransferase domain-containing protein, partial [Pygmaiobacter sp.]
MNFHKVTLEDGFWARPLLEGMKYKTCEFAFANIYMWAEQYGTLICDEDNLVMVRNIGHTHYHFLYPAGTGDLKTGLERCVEDAKNGGKNPMIYSIPESELARVEQLMPGVFRFGTERKND